MLRDRLTDHLKSKKPDAKEGTIRTYVSVLSSFLEKQYGKPVPIEDAISGLNEAVSNIEFIESNYMDKPNSTKKTLLAALYAVEPSPLYHATMMKYSNANNKEIRSQVKSEVQAENWIDYKLVLATVERWKKETAALFRSKEPLQGEDLMKAQNYVILALTTGVFIPPRRSSDWTEFNLSNVGAENNYMKKNELHFVNYKTAKTYGEQMVEMPTKLKTLLTKWKKLNGSDYLLVNRDRTRLKTAKLTDILNTIFGRKISTSMLRHIYLTDKLGHIPALEELDKLAHDMGHNVPMQLEYIKK